MQGLDDIAWEPKLSIGVAAIDDQHKAVIMLYNDTCTALRQGQPGEVVYAKLLALTDHITQHFFDEESVMRAVRYPQLAEHAAIHQQLLNQVAPAMKGLNRGRLKPSLQLMHFLRYWICDHIALQDKQLGEFMASKRDSGDCPAG